MTASLQDRSAASNYERIKRVNSSMELPSADSTDMVCLNYVSNLCPELVGRGRKGETSDEPTLSTLDLLMFPLSLHGEDAMLYRDLHVLSFPPGSSPVR